MWTDHLVILPVVLPLVVGAGLLLIDERRRSLKTFISIATAVALFVIAFHLMNSIDGSETPDVVIYRIGNWAVPFGILLVLDRLSALMLVLTSLLAVAGLSFAAARWHRAGPHFHGIFQLLLVGLNGAFLTGDLFNLFVFLEVLLAASYGLVLHGSGVRRVTAGLHYVVVNLVGAFLILIGVAVLYGVTGTLNMADLAVRIAALEGTERAIAHAGAGIFGIALLIKAGMWPLGFWLPPTYAAASAPVAAVFAIMTKVGIYAIIRLWLMIFGPDSAAAVPFGAEWLLVGGMLTILFGVIGVLSAQTLGGLAGYLVLISSGTLLAVVGTGEGAALGGALYYLISSTLAIGAFFLLIELTERGRDPGADVFAVTREAFGEEEELEPEEEEVGIAIRGSFALLGIAFIACALLLAGLPPLSGFVAKFAMLTTLLHGPGTPGADGASIDPAAWAILALLIASGLATLIGMGRLGIRVLWAETDREVPEFRGPEVMSIAFLLLLCVLITVQAGTAMRYMDATAADLRTPSIYVDGVMSANEEVR